MLNHTSTTAIARALLLAGILLAVTVLAARSFFPLFAHDDILDEHTHIEYRENDTTSVATFTATDPEGETIDWDLTGDNAAFPNDEYFSLTSGVLSFKSPPNFECPKPDANGPNCEDPANEVSNRYTIRVEASAGDNSNDNIKTATEIVVVQVTNVDEMGTIELSSLAPKELVNLTATLTEPDEGISDADVEWTWERSEDGVTGWMFSATSSDTGAGTADDGMAATTRMPSADDAGHFLRVTATYDDVEGMDKEASVVSDNKVVMTDYVNREPKFVDDMRTEEQVTAGNVDATTTRSIMENVAAGTAVGAPVRATDTDAANNPEVLTYTLDGAVNNNDDTPFEIDSSTGQIRLKAGQSLDFEMSTAVAASNTNLSLIERNMYQVTVTATDPGRRASAINVTIEVTNVEELPTIAATTYVDGNEATGRTAREYPENLATSTAGDGLISTYSGTDPEDGNNPDIQLQWSLNGPHADRFMTDDTEGNEVALTFRSPPNFEPHSGRPSNNVYRVTVNVTDSTGKTDSRDVAVTVTNVDERGTITLSHSTAEVGAPITATLTDLDRVVSSSVKWLWTQSADGATSSSSTYRPTGAGTLSLTVEYADGEGGNKGTGSDRTPTLINGSDVSGITVQPAEAPQRRPVFKFNTATTTSGTWPLIREDTPSPRIDLRTDGFSIEEGGESLIYTLGGDTSTFRIADNSIQDPPNDPVITLRPGASLDYERKRSYRVTVRATDPSGDNTTFTLNIPIMDLNEAPEFASGGEMIDYPEIKNARRNTDRVWDYNATDPERESLTWSLADQNDDAAFTLSQSGVLTFKKPPDFDEKPSYSVTIQVTDGADTTDTDNVVEGRPSTLLVTITIENVDEPGVVNLSPTRQPKEDEEITAVLTDPDGPVTGQSDPDPDDNPLTITENASTTWQWARSSSSNGPWTDIEATTTEPVVTSDTHAYTPSADDRNMYLRATASYSDGQGDDKTAQVVTDFAVLREDYVNTKPKFDDDMRSATSTEPNATTSREVAENAAAGTLVGAPVRAVDIGSDGGEEVLTYTLDDATGVTGDADKFEIDRRTGQISVKNSDSLNFEMPEDDDDDNQDGGENTYIVQVTARDPIGDATGTESIIVTIEVTDVKERPKMAAESAPEGLTSTTTDEHTPEGATTTDVLSLYRVNDDEDDLISTTTLTWTVSGLDADMFVIATTTSEGEITSCNYGATPAQDNCALLRFNSAIDFENPTDSNRDNKYNVTVNATDMAKMTVSRNVVVEVNNVNEPGTITLSHLQPEVGTPFQRVL